MFRQGKLLFAATLLLSLAACGGGGGGSAPPPVGSLWQQVGGANISLGMPGPISLVFKADGTPQVVFSDLGSTPTSNTLNAKAFINKKWRYIGAPNITNATTNNHAAAVDDADALLVMYTGTGNHLYFTRFQNGASTWEQDVFPSIVVSTPGNLSLKVHDGNVYAFYSTSTFYVKTWQSGSWKDVGTGSIGSAINLRGAFAIAPDGTFYAAGIDTSGNGSIHVKRCVACSPGVGTWEDVTSSDSSDPGGSASIYLQMAVDSTNHVYLAWREDGNAEKARVSRFDGTDWQTLGDFASEGSTQDLTLAIAPDDAPLLGFIDNLHGQKPRCADSMVSNGRTSALRGFQPPKHAAPDWQSTPTTAASIWLSDKMKPAALTPRA